MADPVEQRKREREDLIGLGRRYVEALSTRLPLLAAAVAGSVARGDFNVWSDVDVVVVAEGLPTRAPDRAALLSMKAPPRVQPVGFTPDEFSHALASGNPLVREAAETGVVLMGEAFFRQAAARTE